MCPGIDFLTSGSTFDTDIELHKNIYSRLHLATYVVIVKKRTFPVERLHSTKGLQNTDCRY